MKKRSGVHLYLPHRSMFISANLECYSQWEIMSLVRFVPNPAVNVNVALAPTCLLSSLNTVCSSVHKTDDVRTSIIYG